MDYAGNRASLSIGFAKYNFFQNAKQFAKKHGANFKKGVLSDRWWSDVQRRHPELKLRQPEATAAVRQKCMDPQKVAKYFGTLNFV